MSAWFRMFNFPNFLTLLRVGLLPVFITLFYIPYQSASWCALAIFILSCITDLLDGYFARVLNQQSKFGAFLDPIADKLLVVVSLLLLVAEKGIHFITLPAVIIVCREIVVSGLREWMAELGRRASIAVNHLGKIKTITQMVAIGFLIAYRPATSFFGVALLYLAAVMTMWSMVVYLRLAWPALNGKLLASD